MRVGPEWLFAAIGGAFGLALVFLTPPLEAPDEDAHFLRAYQMSTGRLIARNHGASCGEELPASLNAFKEQVMSGLPFHPNVKTSLAQLRKIGGIALEPNKTDWVYFCNSALYPPLAYVPQAVGVGVGRAVGLAPLWLSYLGRLFAFAVGMLLTFYSIRITPVLKWVLVFLALTPMAAFQRSSMSTDVVTTGLAYLFTALVLRWTLDGAARIGRREAALLIGIGAALAVSKFAYGPMILLALAVPAARFGSARRKYALIGAATALGIVCVMGWWLASRHLALPWHMGAPPEERIKLILHAPLDYLRLVGRTLDHFKGVYLMQWIGHLGWLDTDLPIWLQRAVAVAALVLVAVDHQAPYRVGALLRALAAAIVVTFGMMVITLHYLAYMTGDYILGVQGRYFIPLSPLIALVFYNPSAALDRLKAALPALLSVFLIVILAATCWTLRLRFYG